MENIDKKQRVDWLDVLKCIGMYLVVIAHASNATGIHSYRYYIYSFHMPLFFIISGMAFYLQLMKRDWSFTDILKNKTKSLIWPYITLNMIAIPVWLLNFRVLSYRDQPISSLFIAVLYSNQHEFSSATNATWFILTLFLSLMIFFLIVKWAKKNEYVIVLSSVALGLVGYVSSLKKPLVHLPWHIDTVPMAALLIMLGYIFMKYESVLSSFFSKIHIKIISLSLLLASGFCCARYNTGKITMHGNYYGSLILFMGAVVCFSLACYLLATMLPALRLFKLIGRNTIVILALHAPFFRFCAVYSDVTQKFKTEHPIWLGTLCFLLMIPICYIFERFLPFLIGRSVKRRKEV